MAKRTFAAMKSFLRIIAYARPYLGYALLNAIANFLLIFFSLASIGALIPALDMLFGQDKRVHQLMPFSFTKDAIQNNVYFYITSWIEQGDELTALAYICGIAAVLFFFKNFFRYMSLYFMAPLRNGIIHDIRVAIYRKCLELPVFYFTEKRKGDIIARASTDVKEIEWSILTSLEMVVREPLMIIGSLIILVAMSPQLTLFVFLVMPISGLIISLIGKSLKRSSTRAQGQLGFVISLFEEMLTGLRIIKAFNAEKREEVKFEAGSSAYRRTMNSVLRKTDLSSPLSESLGVLVVLMVVWFGGKQVLEDQQLTGGALIAYIGFFYQIIPAFKSFTTAIYNVQKGNASAERILEVLDAHNPIKEKENAKDVVSFDDCVVFENVTFTYAGSSERVLKNLNLTIKRGKTIALVGPSGSGKTTISNLLPRFFDVTEGRILLDGIDLRDLKIHSLRAKMGIVTQESILFNDTVANNIALGMPHATAEQIEQAARIANAHMFIDALPEKYQTNIGEGGGKLSGGQKQRISIARALLEDPPILILDEATSALDTESERLVQEALDKLMQNRTSLIIAHRLSTIKHADEIIVLDKGVIAERGTHEELISRKGVYYKLVQMQSFAD
jgi:subfamily B ATP-binding cassette protein MsbA